MHPKVYNMLFYVIFHILANIIISLANRHFQIDVTPLMKVVSLCIEIHD